MRRGLVRLTVVAVTMAVAVVGLEGSGSSAPSASDATSANRFLLTVDGQEIAAFSELSGIVAEVAPSEYYETGTGGSQVTKQFGTVKPTTVTLKRGMTGSLELWAWHEAVRRGAMGAARRSASLTMFNSEGKPVAKYFLEKAWPSKLELGGLKAGAGQALMETVTLTAEHIQRIAP